MIRTRFVRQDLRRAGRQLSGVQFLPIIISKACDLPIIVLLMQLELPTSIILKCLAM